MSTKKKLTLVDGKNISDGILRQLAKKIPKMKMRPGLAAILIGDDPASKLYVRNKSKACKKIGIDFHTYISNKDCYPNIPQKELIEMIEFLNRDEMVHGIIIQLPLPKKYDTEKIIRAMDPKKDADGFHPKNYKKYLAGNKEYTPPLIKAIVKIFEEYSVGLKGKEVVIVSNSKIFSLGLDHALETLGAKKIAIVSGSSKKFKDETKKADVVISIIGKPKSITGQMVKEGAVVIDVGITLTPSGFQGDVDAKTVSKKASLFTPTPGGVGPITVAMLLENTYNYARKNQ